MTQSLQSVSVSSDGQIPTDPLKKLETTKDKLASVPHRQSVLFASDGKLAPTLLEELAPPTDKLASVPEEQFHDDDESPEPEDPEADETKEAKNAMRMLGHDGTLSLDELKEEVFYGRQFSLHEEKETELAFQESDTNHDGKLDVTEFKQFELHFPAEKTGTSSQLQSKSAHVQRSGSGLFAPGGPAPICRMGIMHSCGNNAYYECSWWNVACWGLCGESHQVRYCGYCGVHIEEEGCAK